MEENYEGIEFSAYEENYSEESFWKKVKSIAKKAGSKVIREALRLYYVAASDETPLWAKSIIYGALGYLILPVDIIADFLPGLGFVDDLAVMASALGVVRAFLTDDIEKKAEEKLAEWFGPEAEEEESQNGDEDEEQALEEQVSEEQPSETQEEE